MFEIHVFFILFLFFCTYFSTILVNPISYTPKIEQYQLKLYFENSIRDADNYLTIFMFYMFLTYEIYFKVDFFRNISILNTSLIDMHLMFRFLS